MASDLSVTFLSALQASVSVLVTIGMGAGLGQYGFLSTKSSSHISRTATNVFLPCLLAVNLGSTLQLDTVLRYIPIIAWSLLYSIPSLFIGRVAVVLFGLPTWTVTAVTFNNTTSLPLLLLQSLQNAGILSYLVGGQDENGVLDRARSYFLVCSVVSNTLTFGEGPRTLRGFQEDARPYRLLAEVRKQAEQLAGGNGDTGRRRNQIRDEEDQGGCSSEEESGSETARDLEDESEDVQAAAENTSLLPRRVQRWERSAMGRMDAVSRRVWEALPRPAQRVVDFFRPFVNPPSLGAVVGLVLGLTPALHRLFFSPADEGGYFNAWLTTSLKNVGELFVTLQVIVVGVKLSLSLRRMKEGKTAGHVPWKAVVFVVLMRFVILPAISIPLIWALASRTRILSDDPILWFTMMLMPAGPSAMKLLALADVNEMDEKTKMSIARLLTISYAITPLISFSVAGALKASQAVTRD